MELKTSIPSNLLILDIIRKIVGKTPVLFLVNLGRRHAGAVTLWAEVGTCDEMAGERGTELNVGDAGPALVTLELTREVTLALVSLNLLLESMPSISFAAD